MNPEDVAEQDIETCIVDPQSEEIEIEEMVLNNAESQYLVLEHEHAMVSDKNSPSFDDVSHTNNLNHDNQINLTSLSNNHSLMEISSINEEVITTESESQLNFDNASNSDAVVVTHYKFISANDNDATSHTIQTLTNNSSQLKDVTNDIPSNQTNELFSEKSVLNCDNALKIDSSPVSNTSRYCIITENNFLVPEHLKSSAKLISTVIPENVEIPESFYNQIIQSLGMKKENPSDMSSNLQSFNFFNESQSFNNSINNDNCSDEFLENMSDNNNINNSNKSMINNNHNLMDLNEFKNGEDYDDEEDEEEEEDGEDVNDKGRNVITYTILPFCSTRGRDLLVDSRGYSYANKPTNSKKVGAASYWRCVRRSKKTYCHASVIEKHGHYRPGKHPHSHPPRAGELLKRRIYAEAKFLKTTNTEISLSDVIGIIASETPETELNHLNNTTFYRNVARAVSRRKNSNLFRPIKDLNFALEMERVPANFLIGDLFVHDRRHLIFATERMVGLLSRAKTWYIDKCEELCRPPFKQLMIIHTNIKRNKTVKQVPILFAMMSGKKRKDYARIFNLIKNVMPESFRLHRIISDFQKSLWKAMSQTFPNVVQRGCLYHWTISLWRQLQSLGLQEIYINDDLIHNICRQLMALPFIPPQEIPVQFQILTEKVPDDFLALHSFVEYIRTYWIENHHWPIETWNVFLQPIQASNDCGGLHERLNVASRATAPYLYRLINLLYIEAEYIDTDVRFIEESKTNALLGNNSQGLSSRLNTIWADYMSGQKSCRKLLKSCARIHGPELYC